MHVIAGLAGQGLPQPARHLAKLAIDAQSIYATGQSRIDVLGAAAFAETSPRKSTACPFAFVDPQRWLIVADVRLDNRAELLARIGEGCGDAAIDDGSILLASWIRWGAAGLDLIVGEYAFAIYDALSRTLVLARDSSSERPLFYAAQGEQIAFASMPSGLRALRPHRPDLASLAALLGSSGEDRDETAFEGIHRVRPGELLRFEGSSQSRIRHWQPQTHGPDTVRLSDADYIERYRHLLDEAVRCRLPAEGGIATHLSSGFDSSAVTATAARLRCGALTAFTAAPSTERLDTLPRGRTGDESALASQTARWHGIDHVVVRDTSALFDVVRRQTRLRQAPVLSAFNLAWWEAIRIEAAARGASVLLTGESGNLTLNTGGLSTLSYFVLRSKWRDWWNEARAAARRPDVRWRGIMVNSFGDRMPVGLKSALERHFQKIMPVETFSFLNKDWRAHVASDAMQPRKSTADLYRKRLDLIRRYDSGAMRKPAFAQCGIVEIDPTADRRLVEFSLLLPPDQLLRHGQSRPLARTALADRVPAEVLDSRVRGLQSADWYLHLRQADARAVLEEIGSHAAVRDLLDLRQIGRAIDDWPDRGWNSGSLPAKYRDGLMSALAVGIFLADQ